MPLPSEIAHGISQPETRAEGENKSAINKSLGPVCIEPVPGFSLVYGCVVFGIFTLRRFKGGPPALRHAAPSRLSSAIFEDLVSVIRTVVFVPEAAALVKHSLS